MANRPKGFGMTAELAKKKSAKFSQDLANEAFDWMNDVLEEAEIGVSLPAVTDEKGVQVALKSGIVLCKLINVIKPGKEKFCCCLHATLFESSNPIRVAHLYFIFLRY